MPAASIHPFSRHPTNCITIQAFTTVITSYKDNTDPDTKANKDPNTKAVDTKVEDTKVEDTKVEDTKVEDTKVEDIRAEAIARVAATKDVARDEAALAIAITTSIVGLMEAVPILAQLALRRSLVTKTSLLLKIKWVEVPTIVPSDIWSRRIVIIQLT
jgi:hypothetical protein